jgi:cellulose synthase/poly-beta-1,6-N-acetylglucosamine synthase-like glycosyltransferase
LNLQSPNKPVSQSPSRNVTYVVISPVRDEAVYIEKTLQSVVDQTIRPSEWIIVNDGSTDRTGGNLEPVTCFLDVPPPKMLQCKT